ncbi:unnamed protein product [Peronospora farinosa]|uniref:phospholipase D n=1 Tax=Peronospora farinosa TaxID=134698 RepID=A0ABN8BZM8_9STRA|nr:unnamed protein product [Peronospora farinosa]
MLVPQSVTNFSNVFSCAVILFVAALVSLTMAQDDRNRIDLSDGSNVAIDQPLTEAKDWFLTEQEITYSRGGAPRDGLSVYTEENAITSFTVPNEFFNSVYDDLSVVGDGQRVLIATWDSKLIPLKPDVDVSGATTGYQKVFAGIVERGGQVNILSWANLLERSSVEVRNVINSLPPSPVNDARALFIFDDRLSTISSSHHQKTIVIAATSSSALRDAAGITMRFKGWIDGHIRIHGPAAKDVASNHLSRWNSDYMPTRGLEDDMLSFNNPPYYKLDPLDYASSTNKSTLGKQSVQIVRTFSCKYEHYTEFAPHGETSLLQARIKAIQNARNYIYIEDQYFILVPELLDALLMVMPRLQHVIVVVQAPVGNVVYSGYEKYFYDMVSPLKKKYPNKFKVYTTKRKLNLYIHSKIVIIDDVYLSIGSANWNRRSMTSDSELNANVVDQDTIKSPDGITVNKLARDFRIRKFHEMTGVSYDKLDAMTFLDAAAQFDVAAADDMSLLQILSAKTYLYHIVFLDSIRQQVDPQDTCNT